MKWFTKYIVLKYKYKCLLNKYEFEKKMYEEYKETYFKRECELLHENRELKRILKSYEENE